MTGFLHRMLSSGRVRRHKVFVVNTLVTACVLALDSFVPDGVSVNSLYALVIVFAAYSHNSKACFIWAAISTVVSVVASLFAPASVGLLWEALDRVLTIASLWIVAGITYGLRRAREEAMVERGRAVEAMEAKGRFLSAASHDLRQPVQSVMLFTTALKSRLKGHPAAAIAETLGAATEGLKGLLDAVLDISKLDAGVVRADRHPFALGELLVRIAGEFASPAAAKGLHLRVLPTSHCVYSDPVLVERILRNLVENAVRYTESGGVVIGCRRHGAGIRLDVVDSGPGIPAEQVPKVFDEFYQLANAERSRERGHGLGLAIVRRAAILLGHPVEVASNLGRGTRFSMTMPIADTHPPPVRASETAVGPASPSADMQVLVIEDDPLVLPALKIALEDLGCRVMAAGSPTDALAQARRDTPAMILSDFRLPGSDGLETIAQVRSAVGAEIPASVITGDLDPTIESRSRAMGVGLLRKPIRQEELAGLVVAACK